MDRLPSLILWKLSRYVLYLLALGFDAFRPHFVKRRDDFEAIRICVAPEAGPDLDIILFLLHDNRLKDHQNQLCS